MDTSLILLLIFLAIICGTLIVMKKRKIGLIMLLLVILGSTIFIGLISNEKHQTVFAIGASEQNSFSIPIKHKRVNVSGKTYSFHTKDDLDDLYTLIKNENSNVIMEKESITIFHDNQIYNVRLIENNKNKHTFELNAQYIIYEINDNQSINIPFPEQIVTDDIRVKSNFEVKSSFNELKDYYQNFTNVTIEDQKILLKLEQDIELAYLDGQISISIDR